MMSDASIISAVLVAVVAYVYLTIIRPARRDQAEHRRQIQDLRPGDEVLTTSNFIARVTDIQIPETGPSRISLEIAEGVVVTALPGAILQRLTPARGREPAQTSEQKGASA
jgi:preprotein translocase YajC subunit